MLWIQRLLPQIGRCEGGGVRSICRAIGSPSPASQMTYCVQLGTRSVLRLITIGIFTMYCLPSDRNRSNYMVNAIYLLLIKKTN
jgi:hypothetical protein